MQANQDNSVNVIISDKSLVALGEAVSVTESSGKKWLKASDSLFADGVREWMLTGTDKIADVSEKVKATIAVKLPLEDRKLLAGDVKAMSVEQKKLRTKSQQKIGRYVALLQSYLLKKAIETGEVVVEEKVEGEGEKAEKTGAEKLRIALDTALKIVQGDEKPKGYDPVKMNAGIQTLINSIKQ